MGLTLKQKAVLDFINDYTNRTGCAPTQKEILNHFGLKSFGSVQRYIKYLTDGGYLENDWNTRRGLKVVQANLPEVNEIPLLGYIAAGNPIEALENPDNFVSVPQDFIKKGQKYFALTISGESMIEAGILNGDTVICRQTVTAETGDIIAAVIDNEATLKYFYPHDEYVELRPANKDYKPIIVTAGEFKIAGILSGLIRNYD